MGCIRATCSLHDEVVNREIIVFFAGKELNRTI